jgi:hypothetical protein
MPRFDLVVVCPAIRPAGKGIGSNKAREQVALGCELLSGVSLADQELRCVRNCSTDPLA